MQVFINGESYVDELTADVAKTNVDTSSLVVVAAEYRADSKSRVSEFKGLEFAQQFVNDACKFLIIVSFMTEKWLRNKPAFVGLMSYPNVGYMRMPINSVDLMARYIALKEGTKPGNSFSQAQFELTQQEHRMSKLRHDLRHVESGSTVLTKQVWLKLAEEAGFTGSFEEMAEVVRAWQPTTEGKFKGKYLPGVFVDMFGTLVDKHGVVNEAVLRLVYELAEKQSVTVFTDSDPKVVQELLDQHEVPFNLASKLDLRGAELEIVIDDMTVEEFKQTYFIIPRHFISVSSISQ